MVLSEVFARHHLIRQRQAVRCHDQCNDHLNAIRALVPAVAKAPLARLWWIAFEIGAGQIVEQDFEVCSEQALPAVLQEAEQIRLVHQQLVKAPIQIVLVRQREVRAEQIAHRTLLIPLPVQPPLAAGIDQAIGDQRLQHVQPPCPLPRRRQPWRPEIIQPQLIPHMAGQPAGAPLPRTVQPKTAEPDMHHIAIQCRCLPILGKQRDLSGLLAIFVERIDRPAPRRPLGIVDLAQVQHVSLHRAAAGDTTVLHDAPVAMLLAVLSANLVAQKHGRRLSKTAAVSQGTWSAPHAIFAVSPALMLGITGTYQRQAGTKFPKSWSSCESRTRYPESLIMPGITCSALRGRRRW